MSDHRTVKVVINACFGGFSVSEAAGRFMAERGHGEASEDVAEYDRQMRGEWTPRERERHERFPSLAKPMWGGVRDVKRDDPLLIAAVETLGDDANGSHAALAVVMVPADAEWHIEEYDGNEHVAEDHRTWR